MNIIKIFLASQLKTSKSTGRTGGFTLIEILVALILAVLVIAPLLGFMINILDTDRKEQAKAASEQEIQSALDYISRDLQQAIYVYDADGVERDNNANAASSGIRNQIPPYAPTTGCSDTTNCKPILVFWKRKLLAKDDVLGGTRVGDVTRATNSLSGDDVAVYSLVSYYLIKDSTCAATNTWSCAARIGRFEIRDGIRDSANNSNYLLSPSSGFNSLNLTSLSGELPARMNQWTKKTGQTYNEPVQILVDYIDQSTTGITSDCTSPRQVPSTLTGGFYICADPSTTTTAQVFIRGNSLARISPKTAPPTYSSNRSNYFPSSSIIVQKRGLINSK